MSQHCEVSRSRMFSISVSQIIVLYLILPLFTTFTRKWFAEVQNEKEEESEYEEKKTYMKIYIILGYARCWVCWAH